MADIVALLEIRDLSIEYRTEEGTLEALDGLDLTVESGETVGIVGESGCGKTTAVKPILGLLDSNGSVTGGEIRIDGEDVVGYTEAELNERVRWKKASYIPQNAMAALDPVFTVGSQLVEVILEHTDQSKAAARERTAELFEDVGLDASRMHDYPHELSGGQRQRVTIALALALEPSLIIADEPTTGLDVVVQDEILELIDEVQAEIGCGLIFITHDMSTVAEIADRVAVLYAGQVVEVGTVSKVFKASGHPYTIGLRNAFPRMERRPAESSLITIPGSPPDLTDPPDGCRFAGRCPFETEECSMAPPVVELDAGHEIRCHYPDQAAEFRERGREADTWAHPEEQVTNP